MKCALKVFLLSICSIGLLSFSSFAQSCNNWLNTPGWQSFVRIGDLDIPGTTITVEATFNRTAPYTGGFNWAGDLVSKHNDPSNVNYLLRPNNAEITTSNGFFTTPPICEIELNKTYHAAMTYDGATLKFYRNGYLMSSVPATGALYQNNFQTKMGIYDATVNNSQMIGYINEVRIWNVVRSQAQIKSFMATSLPSPTTQAGLLAYYTFDNLVNKQGNATWNGTLGGAAAINQVNPNCNFIADSCKINPCAINADFSYELDICNSLNVKFHAVGSSTNSPYWAFGDGNSTTGNLNPVNAYPAPGDYVVKYSVSNGTCRDTITKKISIGDLWENIILTPDTSICNGSTKQLRSRPSLNVCWSPTTYLDNPASANPVTSTPHSITYYLTSQTIGPNIIGNGWFEMGMTSFTSQYQYSPGSGQNPGTFTVGSDILAWHPGMANCTDHTDIGSNNMLLVNGASQPGVKVWSQTVPVMQNTDYAFSCWLQNITFLNPAQLQFSINDIPIGNIFTANSASCVWDNFYVLWNSGTVNTATISIVNQNQVFSGNDFALDDISFTPIYTKWDSVKIIVDTPVIRTSRDTSICRNTAVNLITTGAQTYSWTPAAGLSNPAIGNPVATPATNTQYIVLGTTAGGCTAKDTVNVAIYNMPVMTTSNDTIICGNSALQLYATGGVAYNWTPGATLNNPSIASPLATPTTNTKYYVQITDVNTCKYLDSVNVEIRQAPAFGVSTPVNLCIGDSVLLAATGGDIYNWQPAATLNNNSLSHPWAYPTVNTTYTVTITESVCNESKTLTTDITVLPLPNVNAIKSNDVDCSSDKSNLSATGATSYTWSPATTLNSSIIANPVASPTVTTQYTVVGVDNAGCASFDTITVDVKGINKGEYLMPTAFTPNGDGLNDCYGISYWGVIQELEFSIYNRWGERIFYTTDRHKCWDGTFKGVKQDGNVFVYMVRAKTTCESQVFRKGTFVLIR